MFEEPRYYLIGGAVRDKILGERVKDYDFAVECNDFQQMRNDLLARGVKIFQEREEYLTIRGTHEKYGAVDYVCCRGESYYSDGRRPDEVRIGSLLEDQSRRDFSINSIAEDEDGNFLDPFGGIKDLENKILRCVGKAEERFFEDSLRIVRAARFSITKNLNIDSEIISCFRRANIVSRLRNVSEERIREELFKMFSHDTLRSLEFLEEFPLIRDFIFDSKIKLEPTVRKF